MTNEELSPIAQFIVNTMNNKALKDAHAIQRVRNIHIPLHDKWLGDLRWCAICEVEYPCPTIKALDGEL